MRDRGGADPVYQPCTEGFQQTLPRHNCSTCSKILATTPPFLSSCQSPALSSICQLFKTSRCHDGLKLCLRGTIIPPRKYVFKQISPLIIWQAVWYDCARRGEKATRGGRTRGDWREIKGANVEKRVNVTGDGGGGERRGMKGLQRINPEQRKENNCCRSMSGPCAPVPPALSLHSQNPC